MRRAGIAACVALLAVGGCAGRLRTGTERSSAPHAPRPGYALVWAEEFDGTALDAARWTMKSGPHHQAVYTPDAISVADGMLTITTFTTDHRHVTGWISTLDKAAFTYGWFEARIRFSTTSGGTWSAFWLSSPTLGNPIGDPGAAGTEIDVAEHRRSRGTGVDMSGVYAMNLHWDGFGEAHKTTGSYGWPGPGTPPIQNGWHVYAVAWTPEGYRFFLDGVEQWATKDAVSHRPEYLLLTSEVKEGAWAGSIPPPGYGPRRHSTNRMQVDWVRVWQATP